MNVIVSVKLKDNHTKENRANMNILLANAEPTDHNVLVSAYYEHLIIIF